MKRTVAVVTILLAVAATQAPAATTTPKKHAVDVTLIGSTVAVNGSTNTSAAQVKDKVSGPGAAVIVTKVAAPTSATTATAYYASGSIRAKGTITIGTPDANGSVTVTGSGTFNGGTGRFKGAAGTYKVSGTQNSTGNFTIKITGTATY
jgi:hypothetical protein